MDSRGYPDDAPFKTFTLMHSWVTLTLDLSDCYFCINEKTKLLSLQVWRRQWFTSNVHGSPFLFFDIRGDAMGKLAGIGEKRK